MEEISLNELDRRIKKITKERSLTKDIEERLYKLKLERTSPVVYNDILDLKSYIENEEKYLIFLHNTRIWVGNINYRSYHCSDYSGDVECFIVPQFRGNGYAYEALKLLGEKLYEDKIFDFWVSAYKDNLASIKTIEKYGGKRIIPKSHSDKNIILFECKTFPREIIEIKAKLDRNNHDIERE